MSNRMTLETVDTLAAGLTPQEQLRLVARIGERLSALISPPQSTATEEELRNTREKEAAKVLALCDAAAEMWVGGFDAVKEIQEMREERDQRKWPNK